MNRSTPDEQRGSFSRTGSWPAAALSGQSDAPGDPRVAAALEEYLAALRDGRTPDRNAFLAEHASIADSLAECLDGLEFVQSAAGKLAPPVPGSDDELPIAPMARLGDYRILREVGRGGMGVVFEAEQISLGRRVALKVLPFAAALDPRQRQRFQLEAQAAAHLHHTHIVPIFAVGCDQGAHYYAMQFIEGRTLAAVIRELRRLGPDRPEKPTGENGEVDGDFALAGELLSGGDSATDAPLTGTDEGGGEAEGSGGDPMSQATNLAETVQTTGATQGSGGSATQRRRLFYRSVARLGVQAAEALEHAHSLGVVHRDIKPANLMIDARGDLWVTDFGLARFHQDDLGLTRTGDLLGTLRYMSPEQTQARRMVIDHRTDIYSLGVTLYELLTLRPAFDGHDRAEVLHQITMEEPTAPRRIDPSIPRDLETVILKAMSKEPSGRYATAQELAEDFRRFLDDVPIQARRPTPLEHAAKWARRHRPIVVTAVTVLLLTMSVTTLLLWHAQRQTARALDVAQKGRERERLAMNRAFDTMDGLTMPIMASAADANLLSREDYVKAVKFYDQISVLFRDDDEQRILAAQAESRAAFFHAILQDGYADVSFRRAIALFEAALPSSPDPLTTRVQLASALSGYGSYLWNKGSPELGEPYLLRALTLRKALAEEAPTVADYQLSLTAAQVDFASKLAGVGRTQEAAALRDEAAALRNATLDRIDRIAKALYGPPRAMLARQVSGIGTQLAATHDRENAVRVHRRALKIAPDDGYVQNNLAWLLTEYPDKPPYNPAEALELAQKAVKVEPENAAFWNTLGVAQYRTGAYSEAIESLTKSVDLQDWKGLPHDALFLAMAHFRLGQMDKAREWYRQANEWRERSDIDVGDDPELDYFLAEAAALLGEPAPTQEKEPSRPAVPSLRNVRPASLRQHQARPTASDLAHGDRVNEGRREGFAR